MTYFNDLPLPDLVFREGDQDPRDFVLRHADGTPVVLDDSERVELRLRPFRGAQTRLSFASDATSPATPSLYVTSATGGVIQFRPPSTPTLVASAERYRGYFAIYDANDNAHANPKTVPQPRDFWITVLPRII